MKVLVRFTGTLLGLSLAVSSQLAMAGPRDDEPELQWDPSWQRFGALDWTLTGVAVGTALGAELVGPDRDAPYREKNDIDEAVRGELRAETKDGRARARFASDALSVVSVSSPVLVDAVLNAWLARNSPDVAWQLGWLDLEAASISAAITGVTKSLFSRERPYGRNCGTPFMDSAEDCANHDRYYSFISSHSSTTFSAATVSCVSSRYVPLWGTQHPYWPCFAGYGVAATTAVLRIAADRHYASDVMAGALVGTGVGFLVPWLHFRGDASDRAGLSDGPALTVLPSPSGLVVSGVF